MDRCTLCSIGGIPIDGSGPLNAKILIIGEAPNQEEDRRREYFKGKAGDMLTESLTKVGLSRDHVRLENALACRPPSNRTPTDDEIAACRPRLFKLIEQVNPTVIMPLGYVALKAIEGGGSIRKRQGIPKKVNGRWVIPAMHPAFYLIRNGLGSEDLVDALGIARDYAYPTDLNKSYTLLNQIDLITEWYDYVKGDCTRLAMDIESQNLALDAPWLGIGFAYRTGGAVYIPLRTGSFFQRSRRKGDAEKKGGKKKKALVDIVDFWPANIMPKVLGIISDILTSGTFKITTHNGGYDLRRLSYEGDAYDFQHTWAFDTYLADYLLNENKFLDERALGHLTTR